MTSWQSPDLLQFSQQQPTTMLANHATAEDFARWEEDAKEMTDAALLWSARDARRAAEAMRGWNPIAEGRYDDEAHTYGDEIRRRVRAKRLLNP